MPNSDDTAPPQEQYAYAVGRHVYFRYPTVEDAQGQWHQWFNAPDITNNVIAQRWPNAPEQQVEYLEALRKNRDRLCVAIVERSTDKLIGIGSLSKIDNVNRKAEMSCVIGDRDYHGGVHALESLAMLTEIGLIRLNLHKLVATGMDTGQPGLAMTKLLGYSESGRFREHGFINGRYYDCMILEMFQRDWVDSPRRPETIAWRPLEDDAVSE